MITYKLLKEVLSYFCAEEPGQGDYCRCSAYVGVGEAHKKNCIYLRLREAMRGLKR